MTNLTLPKPRLTPGQLLKRAAMFLLLTVLAVISLSWLLHQPRTFPPLFLLTLLSVATVLASPLAMLTCLTLAAARGLRNL
jgi:hypothetical protein